MPDGFIQDPAERLFALLDREEPRIANIFRVLVLQMRDEIDLDELANLIESGRQDEAIERLQHIAERLGSEVNVSFVTAGQSTAEFMTNAGVGRVVFNQVNPFAVAAMQATRLTLVREFTDEQRRATSLALVSGVEAGANPRAQARDFRDSIGLTERQWAAVARYRSSLERVGLDPEAAQDALRRQLRDRRGDAQVLRAAREGQRLTPEKIDWLISRYTSKYIKHRSEVIGRTEALRAVHEGNEEMYRQAIADGTIDPEKLVRTWETRVDGRERHTHLLLNGQKRPWGEPWVTQNGVIRYPGDPEAAAEETIQCRCAIGTRIRQR
ncbi:MAG: hypothetical protein ACJ8DZ_14095 [Allosphingosinicella sp.]